MKLNDLYSILVEVDSQGIPHNVPGARYGKWEINSLGFRGKEIDLEKKEGHIRILCFGVSETFGFYESKDKEWPSQLGEILSHQFPKVEAINASVVGLNLKKNKEYAEKYLLPLKPDIMIILQTYLIYIKELLRGAGRKHLVGEVRGKKVRKPKEEGDEKWVGYNLIKFRAVGSVLPKLEETMERCLGDWLSTHLNLWRLRRRIRKKEKKHLIHKEPMDEVPENTIMEFEKDLRLFVRYLKENHIVPVLSTYPALITSHNKGIHESILLATRLTFCIELSEDGILDASKKTNEAIRRVAEEENIAFVDNDRLIPKTLEYFGDNFHYTDKGSEFIAKNFYDLLNHHQLIR
jgi:lysophospholipase L1-like esterase